jgi:hypothetical protein
VGNVAINVLAVVLGACCLLGLPSVIQLYTGKPISRRFESQDPARECRHLGLITAWAILCFGPAGVGMPGWVVGVLAVASLIPMGFAIRLFRRSRRTA